MYIDEAPKTKAEWKAYIQGLLDRSDKAVARALVVIYNNQQEHEKQAHRSIEHDNKGFSSYDAPVILPIAEVAAAGFKLNEGSITIARPIVKKYWRQLMEASKRNLKERPKDEGKQMDLKVKVDPKGYMPEYKHESDAGMDLRAVETVNIYPGESVMVRTGVHVEIPDGYVGLQFARSGLGSKGITLRNAVGVIDSGYRGEILCPIWNTMSEPFTVMAGMRISQLVIVPYMHVNLVKVDELSDSDRGESGYGSTGVE